MRHLLIVLFFLTAIATAQTPPAGELDELQFNVTDAGSKLSSTKVPLSSLFQGKTVVIDFWATWCARCMAKLPDVIAAAQQYKGKIQFVAINAGESDEALEKSRRKIIAGKLPNASDLQQFATLYRFLRDPDNQLSKNFFGVEELPQLLIYDGKGKLLKRFGVNDKIDLTPYL